MDDPGCLYLGQTCFMNWPSTGNKFLPGWRQTRVNHLRHGIISSIVFPGSKLARTFEKMNMMPISRLTHKLRYLVVLFGCWGLFAATAFGVIIPSGLKTDWQANQPGVVGGIPNVTNIYVTLDSTATATTINNALLGCPSNQVVYLKAGVYNLTAPLQVGRGTAVSGYQANGEVLRGAGPGQTILKFHQCSSFGTISIAGAFASQCDRVLCKLDQRLCPGKHRPWRE